MLVIEGSSSVSGTVSKRSAGSAELSFMGLFVQNILYLFHAGSTAEGCLLLWEKEASQRREAFARWRILTVPPRFTLFVSRFHPPAFHFAVLESGSLRHR